MAASWWCGPRPPDRLGPRPSGCGCESRDAPRSPSVGLRLGADVPDTCGWQTGSLLLNAITPTNVEIVEPRQLAGFTTALNASSLTTSPVASGASCVYFAFAATAAVDVFLSTYDNFVTLVTDRSESGPPPAIRLAPTTLPLHSKPGRYTQGDV